MFVGETTPLLPSMFRPVDKPDHPAIKMLKALSPIDSDFKYQRIWWKILTIIKVCAWVCVCKYAYVSVCVCVHECKYACVRACVHACG